MSGYREDGRAMATLPPNFYSSDAFATKLIAQMRSSSGSSPTTPFFAYLAFTAPHAPLQAPPKTVNKYKGRYDDGYDVLREQRLPRMRALGLVDRNAPPTSRSTRFPGLP
jgi:arylsulfatase A-like enzyme